MLKTFYFRKLKECSSLKILGPIADGFVDSLTRHGYKRHTIRKMLRMLRCVEATLSRRGIRRLNEITTIDLQLCRKRWKGRFRFRQVTTGALEQYLAAQGFVRRTKKEPTPTSLYMEAYAEYLRKVRGLATLTIQKHVGRAAAFLRYLKIDATQARVKALTLADLENFLRRKSRRVRRITLSRIAASLRSFLRFLVARGEIGEHLLHVDSPRIYQHEDLPRAVPWPAVRAYLKSIDRSNLRGLRDYTMLLLIATYGLRSSDVTNLTLDDIRWRERKICICQRKTGVGIELPLTDTVGAALVKYLKAVSPRPPFRNLFFRMAAPIQPLKRSAIGMAFNFWSRRGGLDLAWKGPHCIRHSYAVFLLRRGTSLKTIGDLLGHRAFNSTFTYLRLATEDLRGVALPVPVELNVRGEGCR